MNLSQCKCIPQSSTTFLRQIQYGHFSNEVGYLYCVNKHGDIAMIMASRHGHVDLLRMHFRGFKL